MEVRDPLKIQLQRLEVGMVEEGVEAGKAWEGQAARWEGCQRAGGKWLSLSAAAATNSSQLLGHELGARARRGASVGLRDLGLGLAEWRLRLRRLLNIMLQPWMVHLCISLRCTALKWILRAPLSQKVFMQTLHCTRFFPVVGLTKGVPRSSGMVWLL